MHVIGYSFISHAVVIVIYLLAHQQALYDQSAYSMAIEELSILLQNQ